ncbi:unnamed protein product [Polarella glacialis]|uniref:Cyclin-dependent kinase 2 homolog n=1 Tax=Polarella glacialis TaxID=89957 RepID=A0A813G050_POLGL|nr:unnamed protein product [Polarella glacialis]CAE8647694.1 unnamed protein product [Polarella glacialis]
MPLDDYKAVRRIAEGRFGSVSEATRLSTGERVAVKKIRARRNLPGLDFDPWFKSAERELEVLSAVTHKNVVKLLDHLVTPGAAVAILIYEYVSWDLSTVMERLCPFYEAQVKTMMLMLLDGLLHLHSCNVMHRDLKPANLLMDGVTGDLKIADFGSARFLPGSNCSMGSEAADSEDPSYGLMTRDVCTRWYKSPEMLFGSVDYSLGVDLWAAGCIAGELLCPKCKPLFPGGSDLEQLCFVFQAVGIPDEATWPDVRRLPDYAKVSFRAKEPVFPDLGGGRSPAALGLVRGFLELNPRHRSSCRSALEHEFFLQAPAPVLTSTLVLGLSEEDGHHQHEANEGPMTPVGFSEFGSDGSDFCSLAAGEFEVEVETTSCGLWEHAVLDEPSTEGCGTATPPRNRTPSPPRSGVHRLKF